MAISQARIRIYRRPDRDREESVELIENLHGTKPCAIECVVAVGQAFE